MAASIAAAAVPAAAVTTTSVTESAAWHSVSAPNPHHDGHLYSMSCTSDDACTAVGWASVGDDQGVLEGSASTTFRAATADMARREIGIAANEPLLSGQPHGTVTVSSKRKHHPFYGFALALRWNGTAWSRQTLPQIAHSPYTDLSSVSCPTTTECVAVGVTTKKQGTAVPIAEIWHGTTWHLERLPRTILPVAITCPDPSECIAAAQTNYLGTAPLTDKPRPEALSWNGHRWRKMTLPAVRRNQDPTLETIACPTTTDCTAAGVIYTTAGANGQYYERETVLTESWNGHRWTRTTAPHLPNNGQVNITSIACAGPQDCILTGAAATRRRIRPLLEARNGSEWTRQSIDPNGQAALLGAACNTNDDCTIVGAGLRGSNGAATIIFTSDGAHWTRESTPQVPHSSRLLYAVAPAGKANWVAAGYRAAGTLIESN